MNLQNNNNNYFMHFYDSHKSLKPLNKISHIKFQAITHQTSPTQHQRNPIYSRSIERISRKGPHLRSTYIQKIQKGVETNCWTKDNHSRQIESANGGRQNKQLFRVISPMIQHKSRQSKSFVIKRKKSSNFTSKRSESFKKLETPLQNQTQKPKREIVSYAKQNSNKQVKFIINPCEASPYQKQTTNQLIYHSPSQNYLVDQQQRMRNSRKKNEDKDSQSFSKYLSQNASSPHNWQPVIPLPTYKKQQGSKNVHRLLKKIRNTSKSSLQNNKTTKNQQTPSEQPLRDKKNLKTKTEQKQNKTNKHRIHSGCKTIRVPWGSSQGTSQDIHNRQTKKQVKQSIKQSHKQLQINMNQNMFGGISTICAKTCDSLLNNNSIPTASLKQIYDQLQHIEKLQHPQTISKQLI